jgi:hypothetical protein
MPFKISYLLGYDNFLKLQIKIYNPQHVLNKMKSGRSSFGPDIVQRRIVSVTVTLMTGRH